MPPIHSQSSSHYLSFKQSRSIVNSNFLISSLFNSNINNFTKNHPILKSYGPLILDINNLNYDSGIFIIPAINVDKKPLFLAINCKQSAFSIKHQSKWKEWYKPFFGYEFNILTDFCRI